ncbi:MAG: gliding motility-associated C-terminal domain-containing protein [Chitinophagales bacterium]|nr:gliding motility-associated C-terminal domain-containing protein [Chitinophagales bacterium]
MLSLINEGPSNANNPSYISVVNATSGALDTQIAVVDTTSKLVINNLNALALLSTNGYAYAQLNAILSPELILSQVFLGSSFTVTSNLIQIGSNGAAVNLGTIDLPNNSAFNLHRILGFLGTADNNGNYIVMAAEVHVSPPSTIDTIALYIGKVAIPSLSVTWNAITFDATCTQFQDALTQTLISGGEGGAQDMVWEPSTGNILFYSGVDQILGVIDTDYNGRCYEASENATPTYNLGGLALDSVGQFIALEVQTGKVYRIDTRGCTDGNPGTPCMSGMAEINSYTINGNSDTRGDLASCITTCVGPELILNDTFVCSTDSVTLAPIVTGEAPFTYQWGVYATDGSILTNAATANATFSNSTKGTYWVYLTVTNATGCQTTDSMQVVVNDCSCSTLIASTDTIIECTNPTDNSATFCLPISLNDTMNYNISLDDEIYNGTLDLCGETLVGGNLNFGSTVYQDDEMHTLIWFRLNDSTKVGQNIQFTTLDSLVTILNDNDPNNGWYRNGLYLYSTNTDAAYDTDSSIYILNNDQGATYTYINYNYSVAYNGVSMVIPSGCHTVKLEDRETECIDSINICVACTIVDTTEKTITAGTLDTTCTKLPVGDNVLVESCDGELQGTADFGTWSIVDNCLQYQAGNLAGSDTLCVSACDTVLHICTQTTVIIHIKPYTPDTLYDVVLVNDSIIECNFGLPIGTGLTYSDCDDNTTATANYGSWYINDDNCLVYNADDAKGNDTICIKVCNSDNECRNTIVIVTVLGTPPIAINNDTVSTGNTVSIPILNNDIKTEDDAIALCGGTDGIITNPTNGTAVVNGNNIDYTPNYGYIGIDSIQYAICDDDGADTAWVYITVDYCDIPNTFSPDGNGKNDLFEIPCIVENQAVQFCVYNRWGIEVYKNSNYDNSWDGTYKGDNLPDGTYYYALKYTNALGAVIDRAGFIVIHRGN